MSFPERQTIRHRQIVIQARGKNSTCTDKKGLRAGPVHDRSNLMRGDCFARNPMKIKNKKSCGKSLLLNHILMTSIFKRFFLFDFLFDFLFHHSWLLFGHAVGTCFMHVRAPDDSSQANRATSERKTTAMQCEPTAHIALP